MKKNKGFTLIELIVTIALMLSLLAIAIISFINLSNKKKEEAYQDVKKQVEQAAESYFGVNQFYISDLKDNDENSYTRISLGKLVKEDYLNVVTDPRTGDKLSYCSYVEVLKINGGYVYTYKDVQNNSKTCDSFYYITVTEPGAPTLELHTYGTAINAGNKKVADYKEWYTSKVTVKATVGTSNNGTIENVKYCNTTDSYCEPSSNPTLTKENYENINSNNGSNLTTVYKATNVAGKSVTTSITYNIDTEAPTCNISIDREASSTGWFNKNTGQPTITFTSSDSISGLSGNNKVLKTANEENEDYGWIFSDNAGNKKECAIKVKYDGTAPTCNISKVGEFSHDRSSSYWFNGDSVTAATNCDDCISNLEVTKTAEDKYDNITIGTLSDVAGNSIVCTTSFGIDRTNPTISAERICKKDNANHPSYISLITTDPNGEKASGVQYVKTKHCYGEDKEFAEKDPNSFCYKKSLDSREYSNRSFENDSLGLLYDRTKYVVTFKYRYCDIAGNCKEKIIKHSKCEN